MVTHEATLPPLSERSDVLRWIRRNLFPTWYDSLLTLLSLLFIYWAGRALLIWALTAADWSVVSANLRLFMVGQYPRQHDARLWLAPGR
jgi:general L-amino acid transport system permease protein